MTSPKKIEELLNRFGQTISDLPKRQGNISEPYKRAARKMASTSACVWYLNNAISCNDIFTTEISDKCRETILRSFICHQSDVIERLVAALETAEKVASCEFCKKHEDKCSSSSRFDCEGFELEEEQDV